MYEYKIKRQNVKLKLFSFFIFPLLALSISGICETAKDRLMIADSLFNQKKYTQSFELYNQIHKDDKRVTSAMLLKMAFVKEGLGDFTNALYYLNLYYLKTYDKKVLKKMEKMAEQNKLSGYNYDDKELFLNMYQKYQVQIDMLVICLVLTFFGYLVYQKRIRKKISLSLIWTFVGILIALFLVNNYGREKQKAIISSANVFLMTGPSPGSDVIDVVSFGHRVPVLDHEDVWVKISWNEQTAFIKNNNLKYIDL